QPPEEPALRFPIPGFVDGPILQHFGNHANSFHHGDREARSKSEIFSPGLLIIDEDSCCECGKNEIVTVLRKSHNDSMARCPNSALTLPAVASVPGWEWFLRARPASGRR